MLKTLRIKNFKAWKDTKELRMAPLTVLFGPNSSGKSSIGHLLLALKQTVLSADRKRALQLGDSKSQVDLGTFVDCIYSHDTKRPLEFSLTWTLPDQLEIDDPLKNAAHYRGSSLDLDVRIEANGSGQPAVKAITYRLHDEAGHSLDIDYKKNDEGVFSLESDIYKFVRTQGRMWPLDEPEKFYRISDQTRARFQNAGFLSDFAFEVEAFFGSIHHLGPLREEPKRIYPWSGESFEDVGSKGENAIGAMLTAQAQGRRLNRKVKAGTSDFIPFIAQWLKEIGVIHSFELKAVAAGRKEYEVLIKTHSRASEVRITDVGFGLSQVLPAIVEVFFAPPRSIILLEQPEIHLHPSVQTGLADVFISAIQSREAGHARNVQLIVESHSEHFLNRLQRRIAEGILRPDEVSIYFCSNEKGEPSIEELAIDEFGDISNWPENFFGNEMDDLTARTVAAMRRKQGRTDA